MTLQNFHSRLCACVAVALLAGAGGRAHADSLPEYPDANVPFGINKVFDYSEDQAELQRLDPPGVMAVLEERDLTYVTELGLRHYRVAPKEYAGFAWDRMDPQGRGAITFERTDALVAAAQAHGINLLVVLAPHADAAAAAEAGKRYLPRSMDAYAAWVRAVVERYDGDGKDDMPGLRFPVREWQVEETPDLLLGLRDGGFATTDQYISLLQATADAVHETDPKARVVVGAISSADKRGSGLDLLDAVLASPAGAAMDVVAFEFLPRTLTSAELREVMRAMRQRAGERPLWCTRTGSYSRYTPRNAMRDRAANEETQAAGLVRRYAYMLANGVDRLYEACMTEEGPDSWKERTFYSGVRTHDGAAKQVYSSFRLIVRMLGPVHRELSSVLSDGQNDLVVLQFRRSDSARLLYVLWWDYAATPEYKQGRLEPDVATEVTLKLTDEQVELGEMVQDAVGRFQTFVVQPQDGAVNVPIRRVPVMLRAKEAGAEDSAAPKGT